MVTDTAILEPSSGTAIAMFYFRIAQTGGIAHNQKVYDMTAKELKLTPEERRRAPRVILRHKVKGVLQIFTRSRNFEVVQIHDASPFGLCLLLNLSIDQGTAVQVKYVYKGIQIEASGTVAWKKAVKLPDSPSIGTHGCWVGIFLHPDDIDANFALYQAIMDGAKPNTHR